MCIPLFLLAGLELGLQLFWAPEGPSLGWTTGTIPISEESRSVTLESSNGILSPPRSMIDDVLMHDIEFSENAPADTDRIFCLGGSVTLGYPYLNELDKTFPARLEQALIDVGIQAEVINLGGASFGSAQVLQLVEQLMPLKPSAIVVYSGNNEFFNHHLDLYAPEVKSSSPRLQTLKLVTEGLSRLGLLNMATPSPKDLVKQQRQFLSRRLRSDLRAPIALHSGAVQRQDIHYIETLDQYVSNINAMAKLASVQTPIIFVEPPQNLLSPPGLSLHDSGLAAAEIEIWKDNHIQAVAAAQDADWALAEARYSALIAQSPSYAQSYFERALIRMDQGEEALALQDFKSALELDMDISRPVSAQQEAILALHSQTNVTVVQLETFEDIRRHRALYVDPCHLTEQGYLEVAEAIAVPLGAMLQSP